MIWKTTLAFIVCLLSFSGVSAQFTPEKPDLRLCGGYNCTSNNFTLDDVFISLTNVNGVPLSDTSCEIGTVQQAYVLLNYTSNSNSTAHNVRMFADLSIDGTSKALNIFLGSVSGKSGLNQIPIYGPFDWECGQELALDDILIVWLTKNDPEELTSYDCNTFGKSQCDLPGDTIIAAPLAVEFDYSACTSNGTTSIDFNSTTSGGIAPYTYAWDFDGDNITDSTTKNPTANFTSNSTVTLIVTDSQNLSNDYSAAITNPQEILLTKNLTDIGCSLNSVGAIDLNVSGGTGSYSYLWSGPGGYMSSTEDINDLEAGIYSITVTDAVGCTVTAEYIIKRYDTPTAPVLSLIVQPSCDVTTGSITVEAVDGLEFSIDGESYSASGNFINLSPGDFEVFARSAEGCVSEPTPVTITAQPTTPAAPVISTPVHPTCEIATGSFTVDVVEGLEYSIDGETYSATGIFEDLAANTYNVVARTAEGCVSIATPVTINAQPEIPAAPQKLNDLHACSIDVTLDANDGISSNAGTTISWFDAETGGTLITDPTHNSFGTITYWAEAISELGCISSTRTPVTLTLTEVTAEISGTYLLTCSTTGVTISATGASSGANPDLSYSWTGPLGFTSSSEDPSIEIPGLYTLTVTDNANGCSALATVTVEQDINSVSASVSGNQTLTCANPTITLDAAASIGSHTLSYNWDTGEDTPSITVNTPGTYTVTVTDTINGCTDKESVTVIQDLNPVSATISGNALLTCTTTSITLEASGSTGTHPLSYKWDTGEITASKVVKTPGTYTVTVTDTINGCFSETSVTVAQDVNAVSARITGNDLLTCDLTSITLDAGGSTVNGTASYLWSNDATTSTIEVTAPGTYSVTVTDEVNGCSSEFSVTIEAQQDAPLFPEVVETVHPNCVVSTGSIKLLEKEGIEFSIDGVNYSALGHFEDLIPGTYNLTAKNIYGCISEATPVTINVQPTTPAAPVVSATVQPTCDVATGTFNLTAIEGLEYSIDGENYIARGSFENLTAGTYNVTARNADGCISEATPVTINVQPATPAAPAVSESFHPTCEVATGSFTLSEIEGLEYSINGETYSASGSFERLAAGTYNVTARNADGCVSEATPVTINVQPATPAAPAVSESFQPTCEVATGSFTLSEIEGLEYSINGETYSVSGSFEGLAAGTYNVTARNADGCVSEATPVTINVQSATPAAPIVSETVQPTCDMATGSFTLTVNEGLEYSIDGESYSASGSFEGLIAGTYNVKARNTDGCISEVTTVNINAQPATPAAPLISAVQPTCDVATGSFSITVVEGLQYSLGGNTYTSTTSFEELAPGTYTVIAKNEGGCNSEPVTVTINEVSQPEIIETMDGDLCIEDSTYDLFELLLGDFNENGTWVDIQNTGALTNSFIDPSLLEVGTYSFDYVITQGCPSTTSVDVIINDECVVLACGIDDIKGSISKAVTPNRNFEIGLDIDCGFSYNVKMFNRWGNEVFSSRNYQNNWNGSSSNAFSGDKLPSGTYYYIVEINNQTGIAPIQGYIYLGTN